MASKVMISFPDEFLAEVDRIAQEEHRTRSELVREAIRLYIETRGHRRRPGDMPQVQKAVATQDTLSRLAPSQGEDSVAEIRHWRETRR
jgi:metal-responsive CopG/Arc/MetJ family transcriptional regulator